MNPLITVFGDELPSYAVLAVIGLSVTSVVTALLLADRGLLRAYYPCFLSAVPGIPLGGKLFGTVSILLSDAYHGISSSIISTFTKSGIVFFGGLFGYISLIALACRIRRISFVSVSDVVALGIPLFHSFGRVGCLLAGCCYGTELSSLPLGIIGPVGQHRVPTQAIEAAFELILFSVLLRWYVVGQRQALDSSGGSLLTKYLALYSSFRFLLEFLRGDVVRGVYFGLSFSQYVSLGILVFIVIRWSLSRMPRASRRFLSFIGVCHQLLHGRSVH